MPAVLSTPSIPPATGRHRQSTTNVVRSIVRGNRPGRAGSWLCARCRKGKRGQKAPCVKDLNDPDGPCVPCRKAGLTASACGPISLPPGRMARLRAPRDLLGNWIPENHLRLPPAPPPARRPEHGLDLLGGTDSAISDAVTVEDFDMHDLNSQSLGVDSLFAQDHIEHLNIPGLEVQAPEVQALEVQHVEVQHVDVQDFDIHDFDIHDFDVLDLGIQEDRLSLANFPVDEDFLAWLEHGLNKR